MTDTIDRAVNFALHRFVNAKLREQGKGGFATVSATANARYLDSFIASGDLTGEEIGSLVATATQSAVKDFVAQYTRDVGWFFHDLGRINENLDSLSLNKFIKTREKRIDGQERAFLASMSEDEWDAERQYRKNVKEES